LVVFLALLDYGIEETAHTLVHFHDGLGIFIGIPVKTVAMSGSIAFIHVHKDEVILIFLDPLHSLDRGFLVAVGQVPGIQSGGILVIDEIIYERVPRDGGGHLQATDGVLGGLEDRRFGNLSHIRLPVRVDQVIRRFVSSQE